MLYVSVINNLGVSLMVTMEKLETWSPLWQACKWFFWEKNFNGWGFDNLQRKNVWVLEGNLRDTAWQCHINQNHGIEIDWYFSIDCICLDPNGATGVVLDAMNHVKNLDFEYYGFRLYMFACFESCVFLLHASLKCRSMENDHVKLNLMHKIHWLRSFRVLFRFF